MRVRLPPLDHVAVLSDEVGIIQHAVETVPNRATGYCTDDVARAFLVTLMRLRTVPDDREALHLAGVYLAFLQDAQLDDGRFHNFMSYERTWLDEVGTHDSVGRALWALGYGVRYAPSAAWRRVCSKLLARGMRALDWLDFPRSRAYAILGLANAHAGDGGGRYSAGLRALAGTLFSAYSAHAEPGWTWFEDAMTYDNARLPEALLRAGHALRDATFVDAGLATLQFYEGVTLLDGVFVPIGNRGWYPKGGVRATYAQQPLEALAMIDAELAALDATGGPAHFARADTALAWYYGKNSRETAMAVGGGCYDGLEVDGVNRNMGAESTLAFLAGAYAVAERRPAALRVVR
jgi:hypothetical protein